MKSLAAITMMAMSASLAACGGGSGGGVASTPPPAPQAITSMSEYTKSQIAPSVCDTLNSCTVTTTALPASPANAAGTFDTIALSRTVSGETAQFEMLDEASDLQIKVNPANGSYTIVLDDGSAQKVEAAYRAVNGFGNAFSVSGIAKPAYDERGNLISPGGQSVVYSGESRILPADSRNNYQFQYQWGLRHVSLGVWSLPSTPQSTTPNSVNGSAYYFVHGNQTPVSEVPTSGSASYRVAYSEGAELHDNSVSLIADFASRSLAFSVESEPARIVFEDGIAFGDGFTISGTATIAPSGNLFSGPLAGTLFHYLDGNASDAIVNLDLVGQLSGGFYGPQASELGAVWFANTANGAFSQSGAFVATKN